jgi:glycosyltransferase involved in cell wall biosynthesis
MNVKGFDSKIDMAKEGVINEHVHEVRLAIVVSHPIQHFTPFYRALSAHPKIALTVIYASKIGTTPYFDEGMNTEISWNMDLLGGYTYVFLPEADEIKSSAPLQVNNPSVSRELCRIQPDVVLIYGYNQMTSLRALWWCRRNKVSTIMISDSELKTRRSIAVQIAKKVTVPFILKQFDGFLTVGDCNEEYYRYYGVKDEKLFRSPFTIDEASYRDVRVNRQKYRKEERRSLGLTDDEIVVLTVGKINNRKRSRDVIEAAKILCVDNNPEALITFIFAGNGELMDVLQREVNKKNLPVKFLGFVNVDHLPKIYAVADMILHPSERDPHPLVMSEAACVGLPLVISDRVGAVGSTDIARPTENAIVFPCGDVEALVAGLRRLIFSKIQRDRMSEASLRIFDELDTSRSVEGVVRAYHYLDKKKLQKSI